MSDAGPPSATPLAEEMPAGDAVLGAGPWAPAPKVQKGVRRKRSGRRIVLEWVIVAVAALVLAFGIRAFVFQAFFIPSASMVPTLQVGDRILVDKLLFSTAHLRTGDIIVFHRPPGDTVCGVDETDLVKRVIGLPGETVSSRGNTVYINNKPLSEPWLPPHLQLGLAITKQTVPAKEYFVMGDNRPDSCDSRYWGDVSASGIVGKVVLLWWHSGHPDFHLF